MDVLDLILLLVMGFDGMAAFLISYLFALGYAYTGADGGGRTIMRALIFFFFVYAFSTTLMLWSVMMQGIETMPENAQVGTLFGAFLQTIAVLYFLYATVKRNPIGTFEKRHPEG